MNSKPKVLIVDDDDYISDLVSLYLEKEQFQTKSALDGESALKLFAEFKPDIVILDLMLPGIDGYQVCREIRKTSQVPILRN